jgi:S-adenosylmethionine hydrolase
MKGSEIYFYNSREIFSNLKNLKFMNIDKNPKVSVTQSKNRILTTVVFTYTDVEENQAFKLMNSFFLDQGFSNFNIKIIESSESEVSLEVLFKLKKEL